MFAKKLGLRLKALGQKNGSPPPPPPPPPYILAVGCFLILNS